VADVVGVHHSAICRHLVTTPAALLTAARVKLFSSVMNPVPASGGGEFFKNSIDYLSGRVKPRKIKN
jgi:hypothetical protein